MTRLDLGSGPRPKAGFKGVDCADITDYMVDLCNGKRWPWDNSTVEALRSSHFIEHIPGHDIVNYDGKTQDALFFFFDECYRIAKPDASFELSWPALKSTGAFQDPTHRRYLPLEFTHYLSIKGRKALGVEHYNVCCNWIVTNTKLSIPADVSCRDNRLDPRTHNLWDLISCYTIVMVKRIKEN